MKHLFLLVACAFLAVVISGCDSGKVGCGGPNCDANCSCNEGEHCCCNNQCKDFCDCEGCGCSISVTDRCP